MNPPFLNIRDLQIPLTFAEAVGLALMMKYIGGSKVGVPGARPVRVWILLF